MDALERAKELLKDAGIPVYDPGQFVGECKAPYAVPQAFGNYPTISGRRLCYSLLAIHCYVPLDGTQNNSLAALASKVKDTMKAMENQAKPTGYEGVDHIEQIYKALSRTVEYKVLKAQKE